MSWRQSGSCSNTSSHCCSTVQTSLRRKSDCGYSGLSPFKTNISLHQTLIEEDGGTHVFITYLVLVIPVLSISGRPVPATTSSQ